MYERLATACECGREGLHGAPLLVNALLQVAPVVAEGQVDDTISLRGAGAEAVQVGEVAAERCPASGSDGLSRRVGTHETEDLVTSGNEFRNYNRANAAAGS